MDDEIIDITEELMGADVVPTGEDEIIDIESDENTASDSTIEKVIYDPETLVPYSESDFVDEWEDDYPEDVHDLYEDLQDWHDEIGVKWDE